MNDARDRAAEAAATTLDKDLQLIREAIAMVAGAGADVSVERIRE